jgi:transposase
MDQEALAGGKKNARRRKAWICFQDESGFSLLPSVRATWAPKGQTPVLTHHFNWKRLSMSGVVGYAPDGTEAWLVFNMRPGSYNQTSLIEFLEDFHDHVGDDKVTLIWDGLPSHRSKIMNEWIARQRRWLVVERLPAYGHDLNPMELIWGNLKGSELANLCPDTIDEAASFADGGLCRIGNDEDLCFAFLRHCRLFF